MTPYACNREVIYKCDRCHGLWLTGRRLGVFRNSLANFDFSLLEIYVHDHQDYSYSISSCTRCHQVLEDYEYAYNSGVKLYRCSRCQGIWLPLREMVHLMQSLKLGQSLTEDVRGYLVEMRRLQGEMDAFWRFVRLVRSLVDIRF